MAKDWDDLALADQQSLLHNLEPKALSREYDKPQEFFEKLKDFHESIPLESKKPQPIEHSPPKALVSNARRDLSFFEANLELIDNSIDEWRKGGNRRDLDIEITYDIVRNVGEYSDNAGGMAEAHVYKVFIPGETTNEDMSQAVIGSFGMGAKKAIFRLSDGAKVVSCSDPKFSGSSSVPESWETEPGWRTVDGRCPPIGVGNTKFYFLKLFQPPSQDDLKVLIERIGDVYAPLLRGKERGKKVRIKVNNVPVKAGPAIVYSGARGADPRSYVLKHTFENLLNSGKDVPLHFRFTLGLLPKLPGKDHSSDWGFDVYANGRLIQRHLRREFGFGTSKMSTTTMAARLLRGELHITGHSMGVPWDTHKRDYLADHEVALWLKQTLRPIVKEYFTLAGAFSSNTQIRTKELVKPHSGEPKEHQVEPENTANLPLDARPKWVFGEKRADSKDKKKDGKGENGDDDKEEPNEVDIELSIPADEAENLLLRFDVDKEEDLADTILDCLRAGVAFTLKEHHFNKALALLKVEDPGALSERIKKQLIDKLND